MKIKLPLSGIIPPLVTPLKTHDTLDIQGLETLIEHTIDGGVHGLFILGTTGEGPSLSYRVRYDLVENTCKQVKNRIPVLVGITDTSKAESLKLAKHAYKCGSDAVVAAPPYYFTPSQQNLVHYFNSLADQTTLPLFLYNMPSHTKVRFAPDTVKALAGHENIIGLKDSSGDLVYFQKIVRLMADRPDFSILIGPEELLMPSLLIGGHGGVSGGANMFPELYVELYEATINRDFLRMEKLQGQIMQISSTFYSIGTYGASYLQGLKCALSLMSICNDFINTPFQSFEEKEKEMIRDFLKDLKT